MSKITDEQIKLSATLLNNLSITCFGGGIIGPLAAYLYGVPNSAPAFAIVMVGASFTAVGVLIHVIGRALLLEMDP